MEHFQNECINSFGKAAYRSQCVRYHSINVDEIKLKLKEHAVSAYERNLLDGIFAPAKEIQHNSKTQQ